RGRGAWSAGARGHREPFAVLALSFRVNPTSPPTWSRGEGLRAGRGDRAAGRSACGGAAGAWVGGREQHEPRGVDRRVSSANDRYATVLQGLAKGLERRRGELRE